MTGGGVSEALAAFVKHPGEGEARWWLGSLSVILASSRETGGKFTLIDVTDPEGETPLHVHHREDETFIVLEGEIEFNIGGKTIQAGPGTTVFGPKGVPHAYIVRKGPSRMLFLFTPGGFEDLVMATSEPARERRLPAENEGWPDMEALPSLVKRYGCELLPQPA
jgi:quercetin dioxygenase-like cupin family protein